MSTGMMRTPNQMMIMDIILRAADTGDFIGMMELVERINAIAPRRKTRQTIRCSLGLLMNHGMIEADRRGRFVHFKPTLAAYAAFRPSLE